MAHDQLEQRDRAQNVAVVGFVVAAGNSQHAEPQHPAERVGDQRRFAPISETTGQKVGQAEVAFLPGQQHQAAVQRDEATVDHHHPLLATDRWKIEGKKVIVGHGGSGKSDAQVENRLDNELLHDFNEISYARQA